MNNFLEYNLIRSITRLQKLICKERNRLWNYKIIGQTGQDTVNFYSAHPSYLSNLWHELDTRIDELMVIRAGTSVQRQAEN